MSDPDVPELPLGELHAAAGSDPNARAAIGDFHEEYSKQPPDPDVLAHHAARVRALPDVVATFERWYLDSRVQAFIAELNAAGL